jgi:YggT family protein
LIFLTLFEIVGYIISVIVMLVIVQFVLSLLIAFNVVNIHNDFVNAVWKAVNALLEPLFRPIRRIMPNTGAIDFSPLVLIVGLEVLQIVLKNLAISSMGGGAL